MPRSRKQKRHHYDSAPQQRARVIHPGPSVEIAEFVDESEVNFEESSRSYRKIALWTSLGAVGAALSYLAYNYYRPRSSITAT